MVYGIFDLPSGFSPLYLSGNFKNYMGFFFFFKLCGLKGNREGITNTYTEVNGKMKRLFCSV